MIITSLNTNVDQKILGFYSDSYFFKNQQPRSNPGVTQEHTYFNSCSSFVWTMFIHIYMAWPLESIA